MIPHDPYRSIRALALQTDDAIELAPTALLIASTAYPDLDIARELRFLDSLASAASRRFGPERSPMSDVNTLSDFLFDEIGFVGDEKNYYDPRNSFLNEVLLRRLGIPITLSLIYIEVGKRLDIPLHGIAMPGHFLVGHAADEEVIVDPFNGGFLLSKEECVERFRQGSHPTARWDKTLLTPITNRDFVTRILRNLKGAYLRLRDYPQSLRMSELLLSLRPDLPEERRDRGIVHYRMGSYAEALDDLRTYLTAAPDGPEAKAVADLIQHLDKLMSR